jgi:hypothetical protein
MSCGRSDPLAAAACAAERDDFGAGARRRLVVQYGAIDRVWGSARGRRPGKNLHRRLERKPPTGVGVPLVTNSPFDVLGAWYCEVARGWCTA